MKIKLLIKLPIDIKHGALKGEVFEVVGTNRRIYYFIGKDGTKCGAHKHECKEVKPKINQEVFNEKV